MCRYAKLKSSSFSFAGFMTDKLAATLPHGALSGQDALCTQPIGMAQPAAQVTSHVYEGLFDARSRRRYPGLQQRHRQCAAGRTEVELSQSTASVEPDREPSRSAHVPKLCAAGLQDVRIGNRRFDAELDDGTTGVDGDGRPGTSARQEVRSIQATSGGVRMRGIAFALDPPCAEPLCGTAADLVGSKDMISYIDAELDDGATGVAGYGRPETCIEGIQKAHDASNLGTVPHMTS